MEERIVLFIDTYEKLSPIDDWIRNDFLPGLPANMFTVISGRNALSVNWLSDPGWKVLMRSVHLRSFSTDESAEYLRRRKIPEDKIKPILSFAHGTRWLFPWAPIFMNNTLTNLSPRMNRRT